MRYRELRRLLLPAPLAAVLCGCVAVPPPPPPNAAVQEAEQVQRSVVKIDADYRAPDHRAPWNAGQEYEGVGTGFIIAGQRIMTNAHVVTNAEYLEVMRDGDARRFRATAKFIAHDCDLAILEVKDPEFFRDSVPLEFGDVPQLNSTVTAYGFPIGGQRLSITRGVVSRIEFNTYSHSGLDQHLTVQVDAAINPGNSGGPIVQDGRVVGVAFQSYSGAVAQNTGYMIPTPVIRRMLDDCADGHYDGYVELAVFHTNLLNPALRRYLRLGPNQQGVWVEDVMPVGSAGGIIQPGDVITRIDGFPIDNTGSIHLGRETVQMEEIVERKFHGDKVKFDLIRSGQPLTVEVALKGAPPFRIYSRTYDQRPRFVLFAGLLFQPISQNVLGAHHIENPDISYLYNFYVIDRIYLERPEMVVLSDIVPDPINNSLTDFRQLLVDEINGVPIKRLADVAEAFKKPVQHHVIKLYHQGRPLVIAADQVEPARQRIRSRYGIQTEQYLGE